MQDSVKAILGIFNRAGFEAYYNGEKCRNEFAGSVRFISARKSAGDKYHLRRFKLFCKAVNAPCNRRGGKVINDENFRLSARVTHNLCAVVLAVSAGENRDKHAGLCGFNSRGDTLFSRV